MAVYPKFSTIYNNGGSALTRPMPGQACIFKAFRASFALVAARYIAAADAAVCGDLPLGERFGCIQPIAQTDHPRLSGRQVLLDAGPQMGTGLHHVNLFKLIVVLREHIQNGKIAPLPIRIQRIGQGQIPRRLALTAEVHEDFIFYTFGRIGCKAHAALRAIRRNSLNQPDRADGNEILLIRCMGVILLHNMGN